MVGSIYPPSSASTLFPPISPIPSTGISSSPLCPCKLRLSFSHFPETEFRQPASTVLGCIDSNAITDGWSCGLRPGTNTSANGLARFQLRGCASLHKDDHTPAQFSSGSCGPSQRLVCIRHSLLPIACIGHSSIHSFKIIGLSSNSHCVLCPLRGTHRSGWGQPGQTRSIPQTDAQHFSLQHDFTRFQVLQPREPHHRFQCSRGQDETPSQHRPTGRRCVYCINHAD